MAQVLPSSRLHKRWLVWLAFAGLAAFILLFPIPAIPIAPQERTFQIEATTSQFSPALLKVNPGDQVNLELISMDVAHGLSIDSYGVDVHADPGQPGRLSFIADKAGIFRLRCSIPCGSMHPFITGQLTVGPNWPLVRALLISGLAVIAGIFSIRR